MRKCKKARRRGKKEARIKEERERNRKSASKRKNVARKEFYKNQGIKKIESRDARTRCRLAN